MKVECCICLGTGKDQDAVNAASYPDNCFNCGGEGWIPEYDRKYREVEPLKKGDRVIMHTCIEARNPKNYGKVWTCKTDEYETGEGVYHQNLIFLEDFSGSFLVNYLQKINDETIEELEWANNEWKVSDKLWKETVEQLTKELDAAYKQIENLKKIREMSSFRHAQYAGELREEIIFIKKTADVIDERNQKLRTALIEQRKRMELGQKEGFESETIFWTRCIWEIDEALGVKIE